MKEKSVFQIVVLGIFGFFILFAVLAFAGIIPGFQSEKEERFLGSVTVWGTLPSLEMTKLINDTFVGEQTVAITYVQKPAPSFDRELVEALASGIGPDVILLPHDLILRHRDKILPISYETLGERGFKDRFIEQGELYLDAGGVLALPFTVDPLVMYWNRDIFSSAGVSSPPKYWDEFFALAPRLTERNEKGEIFRSAFALGEYRNVSHAKDILAALIMQAGNPIVTRNAEGKLVSALGDRLSFDIAPAVSAVRFYTEFSNPVKTSYTWNGSLPESREMFAAGDLAVYFGFASEVSDIERRNPHLNFDVAEIPQSRTANRKTTFADMTGFAVLKSTPNAPAAFRSVFLMSDAQFAEAAARAFRLPPVRRDLLSRKPTDALGVSFYDSALVSRAWLDPDPERTDGIFRDLVESVVLGKSKIGDAVTAADVELGRVLRTVQR